MGNCLVLQEKAARVMIMKTDYENEILEHKSLIKVDHQAIMSKFSHAACDENHLHAIKTTTTKTTMKKKKVRFSEKVIEGGDQITSGVVRIKVVISKKELQEMLVEGKFSIDGVSFKVKKNQEITNKVESNDTDNWFPALDSIPEIN